MSKTKNFFEDVKDEELTQKFYEGVEHIAFMAEDCARKVHESWYYEELDPQATIDIAYISGAVSALCTIKAIGIANENNTFEKRNIRSYEYNNLIKGLGMASDRLKEIIKKYDEE